MEAGLPSWVSPPPDGRDGDARETRAWLHTQAALIHDRTQALIDTAATKPEAWRAKPHPAPDDATSQKAWRRDLGNVVAFRDLNQITDTESALGAVRTDDDAYTAAVASLERLRERHIAQEKPASDDEANRRGPAHRRRV